MYKRREGFTSVQVAAIELAAAHGCVICYAPAKDWSRRPNGVACNTFSALVKAGLMTHNTNGTPEPGFYSCVGGTHGYLTPAGRRVAREIGDGATSAQRSGGGARSRASAAQVRRGGSLRKNHGRMRP